MLEICNLTVSVEGNTILNQLNLSIKPGEVHAIMGPNGAGKSTLSKVVAGNPDYEVESGDILFEGKSLLELDPEERAHLGIFISFQYPPEIPGVSNFAFLHQCNNAARKVRGEKELDEESFKMQLQQTLKKLEIPSSFLERNLNEDFSGGEKKRNEILQMSVLNPSFSILDETDSGLDIDALKVVAEGIKTLMNKDKGVVLITHYHRLLNYVKPDFVHVMVNGSIVKSGDESLALELEQKGYDWVTQEELV